MSEIPGHTLPRYSDESRDDALFHYTSADGLIGILRNNEIWSTAYYCANDVSELTSGKGVLKPEFAHATAKMIDDKDPLVEVFDRYDFDIAEYAERFEQLIVSLAFSKRCVYITCFCRPMGKEDFRHGLLSQWRGYGVDGGYALQFSRKKLSAIIANVNKSSDVIYTFQDVYYVADNPLKSKVLEHAGSFLQEYQKFLKDAGRPLDRLINTPSLSNYLANLLDDPLESLLDYLVHTKNQHFQEERECRLSLIEPISSGAIETHYFNRGGLVIPYKKTLPGQVLDCLESIAIGPNSRMGARFRSVTQMVKTAGLSINVRPSHIPFART